MNPWWIHVDSDDFLPLQCYCLRIRERNTKSVFVCDIQMGALSWQALGEMAKAFQKFRLFRRIRQSPVTVHVIEYLSCLSFYIHEYSTFVSVNVFCSPKLIKMTSAGLSRMFAMIILFIFQFQIATNLIKYAVRFLQRLKGVEKRRCKRDKHSWRMYFQILPL